MKDVGHAFEEHTSEVQVRLWAPTLDRLFSEAALALAELFAGQAVLPAGDASDPISLKADDRDGLLFDWLSELLYRTEMRGRLLTAVRLDRLTDRCLDGAVGGSPGPPPRQSVKAITMHGLRIGETQAGYSATVIMDV